MSPPDRSRPLFGPSSAATRTSRRGITVIGDLLATNGDNGTHTHSTAARGRIPWPKPPICRPRCNHHGCDPRIAVPREIVTLLSAAAGVLSYLDVSSQINKSVSRCAWQFLPDLLVPLGVSTLGRVLPEPAPSPGLGVTQEAARVAREVRAVRAVQRLVDISPTGDGQQRYERHREDPPASPHVDWICQRRTMLATINANCGPWWSGRGVSGGAGVRSALVWPFGVPANVRRHRRSR